jgi:choline dehydrogenase-like flavoprotein
VLNTQLSHFEGENKVVTNAVCISQNLTKKIKSKYFILSCGGIENSRILLWAREQNKKLFHKNLPIGQYWMNHPWIVAGIGLVNKRELKKKLNNNFIDYDGPLHFAAKKELLNDKKILSAAIYMNAKEDTKLVKEIVKDVLCVAPEYGKKIARMIFNKDLKCGNIFMNLEEPPNENNKITLDKKEKDLFEIPRVNLFYKQSNVSKITAKIFLEEFADLCRKEDFGRIALKKNVDEMQEFETLDNHHHLGGTRIGDNPNTSVVDKNLKVHFIKNLFVSGSSTFFTGGYTNPTFTIVQLSLRLSEHVEKNLI